MWLNMHVSSKSVELDILQLLECFEYAVLLVRAARVCIHELEYSGPSQHHHHHYYFSSYTIHSQTPPTNHI
jgi:hypothetical protein